MHVVRSGCTGLPIQGSKINNRAPFSDDSLTNSNFDFNFDFHSNYPEIKHFRGKYRHIMSKTQESAQMANPSDMTSPKAQIPAGNREPTSEAGCTPNNHVVEQGMNEVHTMDDLGDAQGTTMACKNEDGDEEEEADVEGILSPTMDTSALLSPDEEVGDTPRDLSLGASVGLGLKGVTMNNSSTVISSGHENQREEHVRESELTLNDRGDFSFPPIRSRQIRVTPIAAPTPSDTSHTSQGSNSTDPTTQSSISLLQPSTPSTPISSQAQAPRSSTPNSNTGMNTCTDMHDVTTPRYTLPNRRPTGWISSFGQTGIGIGTVTGGRVLSDNPVPLSVSSLVENQHQFPLRPRAVSTAHHHSAGQSPRVTSVYAQQPERKVSGTMQYAIAPPDQVRENGERIIERGRVTSGYSEVGVDTGVEFDLIHAGADTAALNGEHHEGEHQIMRGGEETVEQEEYRLRFQVSTAQDEDEIWMAYVRQQLGVLFPDFFPTDPDQLARSAESAGLEGVSTQPQDDDEEDEGNTSARSSSSVQEAGNDIISPSAGDTSFTTATSSTEDSSLSLATPPSTSRPGHGHSLGRMMGGMGEIGVPNVREEISGLRDEIMRLRSVVGGLAEGLRGEVAEMTEMEEDDQDQQDAYIRGPEGGTEDSAGNLIEEDIHAEGTRDDRPPRAFLKVSLSVLIPPLQKIVPQNPRGKY